MGQAKKVISIALLFSNCIANKFDNNTYCKRASVIEKKELGLVIVENYHNHC